MIKTKTKGSEKMAGIGIGESDFRLLRQKQNYYIDKTEFIKNVIDNQSKVILITRPRRFGKTLNMSTLRYYFDNQIENAKELFTGLKIMEAGEKYTSQMSSYPCIYMTFKDVRQTTYENMIYKLKEEVASIYSYHRYLLESDKLYEEEKERIKGILLYKENEVSLSSSIKQLTEYLYRVYQKPVMFFLDEYDVPLQDAYINGYFAQAKTFFRFFYGETFKDNSYLEKAVLTEISIIEKESINRNDPFGVLDIATRMCVKNSIKRNQ